MASAPPFRGAAWIAGALAVAGLIWRVLCAEVAPATFDEVSFLRALTQYDLLAFEPHFPGYALAVLLARIPAALGSSVPYAWTAGLLTVFVAPWAYAAGGRGAGGVLTCACLALSPLAMSLGARPLADASASALVVGGVALAWEALRGDRRPLAAALLLGAAAAAKPDYALWGSALLPALLGRRRRDWVLCAAAWAAPLALAVWGAVLGCGGWGPFVDEAGRFLHGHLFDWGGSVVADSAARLPRFALPLGAAAGASGPARGLALLAALALMLRAPRALRRAAISAALPYALYTLLAQNLEHPRHLLPLVLVGGLLAGRGLNRVGGRPLFRRLLLAAAVCALASGGARSSAQRAAHGRPADQLLAVLASCDPLTTRLYAGLLTRPLRERRPEFDVRPARDLEHVAQLLAADPSPPTLILVSPEVRGAERLPLAVRGDELLLYRWDPASAGL